MAFRPVVVMLALFGLLGSGLLPGCGDDDDDNAASPDGQGGGGAGEPASLGGAAGGADTPQGGEPSSEAGAPASGGMTSSVGGETGGGGAEPTAGAGGSASCEESASCVIDAEHLCDEWTHACPPYIAETQESCQNRGGAWASPAACLTADFVGKCALPPNLDGSQLTSRWYTGADAVAQENFCNGIGMGSWSTSF